MGSVKGKNHLEYLSVSKGLLRESIGTYQQCTTANLKWFATAKYNLRIKVNNDFSELYSTEKNKYPCIL